MKNQAAVETSEIGSDCGGKFRARIVHGQEQAFDLQLRIQETSNPRERVEEFGDTFKSVVFTLNGHKKGIGSSQAIKSEQV